MCMCVILQLGEVKNLLPGSARPLRRKIIPLKPEGHAGVSGGELVVILRGGQSVTQVPDPASQRPPARGFIIAV